MPKGINKLLLGVVCLAVAGVMGYWTFSSPVRPAGAAATLPASVEGVGQVDTKRFRVLTANIRVPSSEDVGNSWGERRELLLKTILKHDPDILGMQEVSPAQTAYLLTNLKEKDYELVVPTAATTSKSSDSSLFSSGLSPLQDMIGTLNQLYIRKSRFKLISAQSGAYRPGVTQQSLSENTFYTLAVLQDQHGVFPNLIVVDTHIRHGEANAIQCAKRLHEILGATVTQYPNAQIVVMGDMNHDRTSKVYTALEGRKTSSVLQDSFDYSQFAKNQRWGTFHGFTGKGMGDWPVDMIWHSEGLKADPATIIQDKDPETGRYPSDHFFVKTIFGLPESH